MREVIEQASAFCEDEHIPKWFGMPFLIIGFIAWKVKEKLWQMTSKTKGRANSPRCSR